MDSNILKKPRGKKQTLTEKINTLEKTILQLSSLIKNREEFSKQSFLYCKKHASQNNALNFVIDAYNNSYIRIIDDKIQQMQHLSKLEGYLNRMIKEGTYDIYEIQRAKEKQKEILNNINETRMNMEALETMLSLSV